MDTIDSFDGEFRFLSNFFPAPVEIVGKTWPTAEHAFQAMKTTDPRERELIALASSPGRAKRAGRKVTVRPDWEEVKLGWMARIVHAKFEQNGELADRLLATGDATLIEGNNWGDKVWGQVDGEGENLLGRILMSVRQAIRTERTLAC
jgi:ribA/ribD-fused uncharacterized protein